MTEENKMMMTVVEVKIDEDLLRHPAIPESDPWGKVCFIRGDKIVASGYVGSRRGAEVVVYLNKDDVASFEYFKDDPAVKILGHHAGWRFMRFDGGPIQMYVDDPEDRCADLWVVSKWEFDYGYASKKRYGHIEGFGAAANRGD